MKKYDSTGSFLGCFLLNLAINLEWAIPAGILLILHFWLDISVWPAAAAFAAYVLAELAGTLVLGWGVRCGGRPTPQRPNRNPYSDSTERVLNPVHYSKSAQRKDDGSAPRGAHKDGGGADENGSACDETRISGAGTDGTSGAG